MNNRSKNLSSNNNADEPTGLPTNDESIGYIKQYIDASAESADRVRFVLIVMVTASILAIVAFWNSRQGGWPLARLVVATNAEKFYDPNTKKLIPLDDNKHNQEVWLRFFDEQLYQDQKNQADKDKYWNDRRQAYESARKFIYGARFADLDHLKQHVQYLERTRIEKVLTITVPFFGIVLDINDLGIFAGITFIIALLLFRFSLLRELRNLRLVFMQAKTPEHLSLCYDMLAMQQVLTTPPELSQGLTQRKVRNLGWWREAFWNLMSKGLYLLPFAAQLAIFYNDYDTYKNVAEIFPGTGGGLRMSGTLLVLNASLTVLCIYLGWKVDKTWRNHAKWILNNRFPAQEADETGGDRTQETALERQEDDTGSSPGT